MKNGDEFWFWIDDAIYEREIATENETQKRRKCRDNRGREIVGTLLITEQGRSFRNVYICIHKSEQVEEG